MLPSLRCFKLLFLVCLGLPASLTAQYAINGDAFATNSDCFTLTSNVNWEVGSVWSLNQVEIGEGFDLYLRVFLGCNDGGADGVAFVLQQVSNNVGSAGGGIGYQAIQPALALEIDTWQNFGLNDPPNDHIALQINGNPNHGLGATAAGPVSALVGGANIEDCQWHDLRVTWNADSQIFRAYLDCELRLTYQDDIINNIFQGDSRVFWGFTSATGGAANLHQFCLEYISFTESLRDTAICAGDSVRLSVGSGDQFSWTPSAGLNDATSQTPVAFPDITTTYRVTVTDPCGQIRRDSVTIYVEQDTLSNLLPDETRLCGPVSPLVDASRPFATYSWSDGLTDSLRSFSQPGDYILTLGYACGITSDTISVLPAAPEPTFATDSVACGGGADGSITLTTFGEAPYQLRLFDPAFSLVDQVSGGNGPQFTHTFTNLSTGIYLLSTADAFGCTDTLLLQLAEPDSLLLSTQAIQDPLCPGTATGSLGLAATGGTGAYTYRLNGGPWQTSPNFSGLAAGTYSLAVQDEQGCITPTSATLTDPLPVTGLVVGTNDVACFGASSGWLRLRATGPGPFSFALNNGPFGPDSLFTGLPAGSYTLRIEDSRGCQDSLSATLGEPQPLAVQLDSLRQPLCAGASNGTLFVSGSGGQGGYLFGLENGPLGNSTAFGGLNSDSYLLTVQDDSGCVATATFALPEPTPLSSGIGPLENPACTGTATGSVQLSVVGGTSPYQYALAGGSPQPDSLFTSLPAGSYDWEVTDANGCRDSVSATLADPPLLMASVLDQQNVDCQGNRSGRLEVGGNGGTPPYTYALGGGPYGPAAVFDSLFGGFYTLRVRDLNGCLAAVDTFIATPTDFVAGIDSLRQVACFGDSSGWLSLRGQGGTPPYTFTLGGQVTTGLPAIFPNLPALTDTLLATDANGCLIPIPLEIREPTALTFALDQSQNVRCFGLATGWLRGIVNGGTLPYQYTLDGSPPQDSARFDSLVAGTYFATAIDSAGCTADFSATLTEPTRLALGLAQVDSVVCWGEMNGRIALTTTGGTLPYVFQLDTTAYQPDSAFAGLPADTYTLRVRDDSLCLDSVAVTVAQPDSLQLAVVDFSDPLCFGDSTGTVQLSSQGGTRPHAFSLPGWASGPDSLFAGLPSGPFTFQLTDRNGCQDSAGVTLGDPPLLEIAWTLVEDVRCFGEDNGQLTVQATGGTPAYAYSFNGAPLGPDTTYAGLVPGRYQLRVEDSLGCEAFTDSATIAEPDLLFANLEIDSVRCFGENSGTAVSLTTGGNPPYEFQWDTPSSSGENLPAGTFRLLLTDSKGCEVDTSLVVEEPDPMLLTLAEVVDAFCSFENGSAEVMAMGGNGSYQFQWQGPTPASGAAQPTLLPGAYLVRLSDLKGCEDTLTVTVGDLPPPEVSFDLLPPGDSVLLLSEAQPLAFDNQSAGVVLSQWDFGDNWGQSNEVHPVYRYEEAGTYLVSLTGFDPNFACPQTFTRELTIIPDGQLYLANAFTPNGDGRNDRFRPIGEGVVRLEWRVFSRWGVEIARFNDPADTWDGRTQDGRPAPEGVYTYILEATFNSGENLERGGTVTLYR